MIFSVMHIYLFFCLQNKVCNYVQASQTLNCFQQTAEN